MIYLLALFTTSPLSSPYSRGHISEGKTQQLLNKYLFTTWLVSKNYSSKTRIQSFVPSLVGSKGDPCNGSHGATHSIEWSTKYQESWEKRQMGAAMGPRCPLRTPRPKSQGKEGPWHIVASAFSMLSTPCITNAPLHPDVWGSAGCERCFVSYALERSQLCTILGDMRNQSPNHCQGVQLSKSETGPRF